jgi:hypothetical protein
MYYATPNDVGHNAAYVRGSTGVTAPGVEQNNPSSSRLAFCTFPRPVMCQVTMNYLLVNSLTIMICLFKNAIKLTFLYYVTALKRNHDWSVSPTAASRRNFATVYPQYQDVTEKESGMRDAIRIDLRPVAKRLSFASCPQVSIRALYVDIHLK